MNPQVIKEIRDAIYGDAYTAIHAVVIFEDRDRVDKFFRIWDIVSQATTRIAELKDLQMFLENEEAKQKEAHND